jgi:hypothetical protein
MNKIENKYARDEEIVKGCFSKLTLKDNFKNKQEIDLEHEYLEIEDVDKLFKNILFNRSEGE